MNPDPILPFKRYPALIWATEILWALLLIGLPLTSFPLLGNITRSVVVPFSAMPLLAILIIWFIPFIFRRGKLPFESKPLIVFLAIAVIASAATFFLGPIEFKNKTILAQEIRTFITLAIGISFYFTLAAWTTDKSNMKKALQLINIGGAIMIVWALVQAYFIVFHGSNYPGLFSLLRDNLVVQNSGVREGTRVTGLAYEPSWFAHLLNVLYFPLWLSATYQRISAFRLRLFKIISIENILLLPSLVVFVLSSPRVGMVAFLLILVFLLVKINVSIYRMIVHKFTRRMNSSGSRVKWVKVAIQVSMVIIFIGVYVGGIFAFVTAFSKYDYRYHLLTQPFSKAELSSLSFNEDSLLYISNRFAFLERAVYWFTGWHTFNDYPWLGVGLGNSGFYFPAHVPYQGWGTFEIRGVLYRLYDLPNVKSLWIRLLSDTGLLGFSLFVTWYYILWRSARFVGRSCDSTLKLVSLAGQLALIAFLVEGFSIDSFALPFLWVITALTAANGALYRQEMSNRLSTDNTEQTADD
jgi:hypothetical protein